MYRTDSYFDDDLLSLSLNEVVLLISKFLPGETFEMVKTLVQFDFLNFSTWQDVLQTLLYHVELSFGQLTIISIRGEVRFFLEDQPELLEVSYSSLACFYESIDCLRDTNVRGGGRFISKKIKSLGTGGKSKVNRTPNGVAPVVGEQARAVEIQAEGAEEDKVDEFQEIKANFICSDRPNVKTTHTFDDLFRVDRWGILRRNDNYRLFDVDCHGNPFCGLVCIDHSVGEPIDIDSYLERNNQGDPLDLGTINWLEQYANFRGVNLACVVNDRIHVRRNNPGWKYVVLKFIGDDPAAGHWVLCCHETTPIVFDIMSYFRPKSWFQHLMDFKFSFRWFAECFYSFDVVLLREYTNHKYKDDQRCMVDRRDKIESEETYSVLGFQHKLFGIFSLTDKTITISKQRFLHVMREAELLNTCDRLKAISTISRLRGINTEMSPGLFLNTKFLCELAISRMADSINTPELTDYAFNASNYSAVIPNLRVVLENQQQGLAGAGTNHVRNPRIKKVKVEKKVGWGGVL